MSVKKQKRMNATLFDQRKIVSSMKISQDIASLLEDNGDVEMRATSETVSLTESDALEVV
jgi:hypothetical protein